MQLIYDDNADALEIMLSGGIVTRTIQVEIGTLVDVDEHGEVVALELLQPHRPWPLDEIFGTFRIGDEHRDVLLALQARQDFALEPAAPLALA